jgi:small subunit ribosomal protein S7
MQDDPGSEVPKGTRAFSTYARRRQEAIIEAPKQPEASPGLKFEMPPIIIPRTDKFRERYDPVVNQVTRMLMRHGKLSAAQRVSLHKGKP